MCGYLKGGERMVTATKTKKSLPHKYRLVADVLGEGKQSAKTTKNIMQATGLKSKRDVMEIIERLIIKYGYIIGSSRQGEHKGYYLIQNKSELKETLFTFNNQIQSMLKRYKALQANYNKTEGE